MVKLITPPGMLLGVAILSIFTVYAFLIWMIEGSALVMAGGLIGGAATYGVAMVRPWSRYLVYALTAGVFAKLGLSIYEGYASGYFEFHFDTPGAIARALLPTAAMAALELLCCAIVYRQFRTDPAAAPSESPPEIRG